MKSKIALSAVLILGATSGVFADVAENKLGDIYPVPAARQMMNGHQAKAWTPARQTVVSQEKTFFDRQTVNRF